MAAVSWKLVRFMRYDAPLPSPIQHRSAKALADLAGIRSRDALVSARTDMIVHVRGRRARSGRAPLGLHTTVREQGERTPNQ